MSKSNIDSTSDQRTVNNTLRHQYRVLSDEEKQRIQDVKNKGDEFLSLIGPFSSREISIAKTKVEEAVMWAVKHITK